VLLVLEFLLTKMKLNQQHISKPHLWLIALVGVIVPRRLRADWRQEWEAELHCREMMLADWDKLTGRARRELFWRSVGAFWDALSLQPRRLEDEMFQDLRFGLRMLRKKPGFAAVAIVTLALGIGANTAIFSVINATLLRPLPYAQADQLMLMSRTEGGDSRLPFPPAAFADFKTHNSVFTDLAALSNKGWAANLTGAGEPERLQGYQVSANLFSLLGVPAQHGRTFMPEEDSPGENRVVVITDELWHRRFGGDRQIIGRALTLNGENYTVIGVMPKGFRYFSKADIWTPLAFTVKEANERNSSYLVPLARLKPNMSVERATAETQSILDQFIDDPSVTTPTITTRQILLEHPQAMMTKEVRPMLLLLLGAVCFVLLIASANVANLLLARANSRRGELAIRSALGAGRFRIVRQLMVESTVLAFMGGAAGLLLANWAIQFLVSGLPEYLTAANSRIAGLQIDFTALGFTAAVSLAATILFSLAPAVQLSSLNLSEALKESARTGAVRSRLRSTLVIVEVALATVLLVGAGVMIRSFSHLTRVDLGYQPDGVITARIDPTYKTVEQVNGFYHDLLDRISSIPGVRNAGMINSINASMDYFVGEHPSTPREQWPSAQTNQVSPDYFNTMRIPLRAGRFFNDRDVKGAQPVIVIDETLARQQFKDEDPIGKHINIWKIPREIVGVVGGAKFWGVTSEPSPHIYFPYTQENWWSMSLMVRAESGAPEKLTAAIQGEVAAIDGNLPIHSFKRLDEDAAEMVAPQRFTTFLLAAFALLAAALAAIGIYGVMSYSVAQRTREIGVRMALGAQAGNVMKVVMKQGMMLAVAGVSIGLVAAYWMSGVLKTSLKDLLFGIEARDTANLAMIALLTLLVASVACLIPARRATKVDPISALRND
jgi:putative ABC transport system permease protein